MTRDEWIERCTLRLQRQGARLLSSFIAKDLADEQTELHGASGVAWEKPDDAADRRLEEMGWES